MFKYILFIFVNLLPTLFWLGLSSHAMYKRIRDNDVDPDGYVFTTSLVTIIFPVLVLFGLIKYGLHNFVISILFLFYLLIMSNIVTFTKSLKFLNKVFVGVCYLSMFYLIMSVTYHIDHYFHKGRYEIYQIEKIERSKQ